MSSSDDRSVPRGDRLSGSPGFDRFVDDVRSRRTSGRVILHLSESADTSDLAPIAAADRLMECLALTPLGAGWRSVPEHDARAIVSRVLSADLAYGAEIMPAAEADALADRFLAFFDGDCSFFTNTHPMGTSRTIAAVTNATVDEGIVAVTRSRSGILWVADED